MPFCRLYCQRCKDQRTRALDESDFALLISTGMLRVLCQSCRETTFWKLLLPPRGEPEKAEAQLRRRVLVIDDDPVTLRLLQKMLEKAGHSVETAASADEAIERLQLSDFDAIVADILMPDFDGPTLYRFLAVFLPPYARRVVFVTADHSEKTLRFFKECRCPYLFKPIDQKQLIARLQEIC